MTAPLTSQIKQIRVGLCEELKLLWFLIAVEISPCTPSLVNFYPRLHNSTFTEELSTNQEYIYSKPMHNSTWNNKTQKSSENSELFQVKLFRVWCQNSKLTQLETWISKLKNTHNILSIFESFQAEFDNKCLKIGFSELFWVLIVISSRVW